jgi:hypothetical protein
MPSRKTRFPEKLERFLSDAKLVILLVLFFALDVWALYEWFKNHFKANLDALLRGLLGRTAGFFLDLRLCQPELRPDNLLQVADTVVQHIRDRTCGHD